jgi:hypothetical protein
VLLWEKHPYFIAAVALMSLILLSMMKRLLFGRRPKVIVQRVETAPAAPKRASNAPPIRTADKG